MKMNNHSCHGFNILNTCDEIMALEDKEKFEEKNLNLFFFYAVTFFKL